MNSCLSQTSLARREQNKDRNWGTVRKSPPHRGCQAPSSSVAALLEIMGTQPLALAGDKGRAGGVWEKTRNMVPLDLLTTGTGSYPCTLAPGYREQRPLGRETEGLKSWSWLLPPQWHPTPSPHPYTSSIASGPAWVLPSSLARPTDPSTPCPGHCGPEEAPPVGVLEDVR